MVSVSEAPAGEGGSETEGTEAGDLCGEINGLTGPWRLGWMLSSHSGGVIDAKRREES